MIVAEVPTGIHQAIHGNQITGPVIIIIATTATIGS